ncbi:MAG: hypothetical protein Q7U53_10240 [Anaerolineaceae bacterium]|nr:hypothetical protein [Anaerolineaceae bacterium]
MIDSPETKQIKENLEPINRCPICQSGFLQVKPDVSNEQLIICPMCGIKFRLAPSKDHLMLVETPLNFPTNLVGLWLTRAQIGKALHEYRMVINKNGIDTNTTQKTIDIPKANPVRAQAVRQAREMIAVGKSPATVHKVLVEKMQLTDYAIEEIIQDAISVKKALRKQKFQKVIKVLFAIFLLLVISYIVLLLIYG